MQYPVLLQISGPVPIEMDILLVNGQKCAYNTCSTRWGIPNDIPSYTLRYCEWFLFIEMRQSYNIEV